MVNLVLQLRGEGTVGQRRVGVGSLQQQETGECGCQFGVDCAFHLLAEGEAKPHEGAEQSFPVLVDSELVNHLSGPPAEVLGRLATLQRSLKLSFPLAAAGHHAAPHPHPQAEEVETDSFPALHPLPHPHHKLQTRLAALPHAQQVRTHQVYWPHCPVPQVALQLVQGLFQQQCLQSREEGEQKVGSVAAEVGSPTSNQIGGGLGVELLGESVYAECLVPGGGEVLLALQEGERQGGSPQLKERQSVDLILPLQLKLAAGGQVCELIGRERGQQRRGDAMELHEGLAEVRRGKKESDKALEVILLMRLGVRQERSGDGDGGRGERLCQESSECGDGVLSIERVFGGLRDTRTEKVELVEL